MANQAAGADTAMKGSTALGYVGAATSFASSLISSSGARWNSRFEARQTLFQNQIAQGQQRVQNASSLLNYQVGVASAQAQYTVAVAQAEAENTVRQANNERSNAQSDLANFSRSLNNSRLLEAAGNARESAVINRERMREQFTDQSIEGQIAAAEMSGAYAASVAMSGVGGGSVDQITQAAELKAQRMTYYQERNNGYAEYDQMQQIIGIIPQALGQFDTTVNQANFDAGITLAPLPPMAGGAPVPGVTFNQNPGTTYGNVGTDILAWFTNPDNDSANRQMAAGIQSWFGDSTKARDEVALYRDNPFMANNI